MVKPQAGGKRERHDGVNSGRFKGVRMRKWGKWVAEVRQPNSRDRIWLGSYDTSEEAARAYDAAVFCLRGPTAVMNFPDDPPDILSAGELSPPQIQVAASRHARRVLAESTTSGSGAVALELKPPVVESALFGESEYMGSSSFVDFSSTDCYLAAEEGGGPGGGGGGDGSGNERALSTHAYFGTQMAVTIAPPSNAAKDTPPPPPTQPAKAYVETYKFHTHLALESRSNCSVTSP
ncbi:AP2/ERF transcription factor [Abeliophyllum distichum]|uniref:AP2/ERF transcription factor n=1 Tax=Abeliophyllum distichum TaxID=126358 RepID=A0ABD1NZW9_9LAMI